MQASTRGSRRSQNCQASCDEQAISLRVDAAMSSARTLKNKIEAKRKAAEKKKAEEAAKRVKEEKDNKEDLDLLVFDEGEDGEEEDEEEDEEV